jgi:hypothetical protein
VLVPALAGAAAALWFALRPAPEPAPPVAVASSGDGAAFDEPLFDEDPFDWNEETDEAATLPPDYLTLAMVAELNDETEETP